MSRVQVRAMYPSDGKTWVHKEDAEDTEGYALARELSRMFRDTPPTRQPHFYVVLAHSDAVAFHFYDGEEVKGR